MHEQSKTANAHTTNQCGGSSNAAASPNNESVMTQGSTNEIVATVGLGYVGLPVALAFSRAYETIGFDINEARIDELRGGTDRTREVTADDLGSSTLKYSSNPADLQKATVYVVAVPTPIDSDRRPDLRALKGATRLVGGVLSRGDLVVFESTVYPGVTQEICGPILSEASGLPPDGFQLAYSPERINPGDKEHRLETITKVVGADTDAALDRVARLYESIVPVGVYRAMSIRVAEAAKVIENTQRDVNIALMNELALIFERMDLRTADVLAAAGTKWNFLPFHPGLVGGHCIGVDPYYLTSKAESLGYHPQVILSGRRINDGMGAFIAQKLIKMMIAAELPVKGSRVAVLGLTFKEDVPDLRNSRVPDILEELAAFGVRPDVFDPVADPAEAVKEYGVTLSELPGRGSYDGVIWAVPHHVLSADSIFELVKPGGIFIDVKSKVSMDQLPGTFQYWSL